MIATVWIVSPPGYPHSRAFDETALGLQAALRQIGYDASISRGPERLDGLTIALGCNLLPVAPKRERDLLESAAGPVVLFNLEQIVAQTPWFTPAYCTLLKRHPVWDYSARNIAELTRLGIRAAQCRIGYVPELTRIPAAPETIDVLFVGSLSKRRARILNEIARAGVRLSYRFNLYGEERDALIARSKILLNLHQFDAGVFELVRVSYLLANRKCVVSEPGFDPAIEAPFKDGVFFTAESDIPDACLNLLADEDRRRSIAETGFGCISAQSQTDCLRAALAQSGVLPGL